jgi:three-Cys-motif partner protein
MLGRAFKTEVDQKEEQARLFDLSLFNKLIAVSKNVFGGSWTEMKMKIVVEYAKAYLTIMAKQKWAKTIYFDGFAGSGIIETSESEEIKKGTALRILDITEPAPFDMYYFVELNEDYKNELEKRVNENYFGRNAHVVKANCNDKLIRLADFLKKNKIYRALAFIDPYGMSVNWKSIEALKDLGIDLWILVPTGIGVNRMLKNDGNISNSWYEKLENFLGLNREKINAIFYKQVKYGNLFGDETTFNYKENNSIGRIHELYKERLLSVFDHVSEPFVLRNTTGSVMYHFMMATNNKTALKIANDIIKPIYKL